ncbi:MAG: LAGLIDADG family homing endonuclease [bacterium]|nr:LAGLIDADG family homing endonuclease [bacterium]
MAEMLSGNRLDLPKVAQKEFLEKSREKLGLSNKELASLLGVHVRTLADWKRRKFLLPEKVAEFLFKRTGVKIPESKKLVDQFWYTKKGGKMGAEAVLKKYGRLGGDPKARKIAWLKWWQKTGKFKKWKMLDRKPIAKPGKNVELAEFVGIMLGDGGMTKNQVTISLNRETDADYMIYVNELVSKLFKVTPSFREDKNSLATDIVVSRMDLVDFCKSIGLKVGNKVKQQVDIPGWVKNNKQFLRVCIRGLVDTDGSVFEHKYRVGGKLYRYKKIDFSSCSKPLLNSVFMFLKNLELRPRIVKDGKKLRIESIDTVKKYMEVVGTSNKKHLNRYNS